MLCAHGPTRHLPLSLHANHLNFTAQVSCALRPARLCSIAHPLAVKPTPPPSLLLPARLHPKLAVCLVGSFGPMSGTLDSAAPCTPIPSFMCSCFPSLARSALCSFHPVILTRGCMSPKAAYRQHLSGAFWWCFIVSQFLLLTLEQSTAPPLRCLDRPPRGPCPQPTLG